MPERSSPDAEPRPTLSATGVGRLAVRWGNWAANLFVSGVVLVLGLTFGREVMEAWRAAPDASRGKGANVVAGGAEGNVAVDELWFNELPLAVNRGSMAGTLDEVLEQVVAVCERASERSLASQETWERKPGAAERRLLSQLDVAIARSQRVTPAGSWTVFERRRPVPLVVAVGEPVHPVKDQAIAGRADEKSAEAAERRRVLAWGMILPDDWKADSSDAGPATKAPATEARTTGSQSTKAQTTEANGVAAVPRGRWAWFTWRPQAEDRPADGWDGPQVPGGRCVMRIASADGSERWAFSGTGSPDAWRAGFDQWFAARGWQPLESAAAGPFGNRVASGRGSPGAKVEAQGAWRTMGGSRWLGSFQSAPASLANSASQSNSASQANPAFQLDSAFQSNSASQSNPVFQSNPAFQSNSAAQSGPAARRADAQVIQEPSTALRALLIVYPAGSGE